MSEDVTSALSTLGVQVHALGDPAGPGVAVALSRVAAADGSRLLVVPGETAEPAALSGALFQRGLRVTYDWAIRAIESPGGDLTTLGGPQPTCPACPPFKVALVILHPEGVAPHDDFVGRRVMTCEATDEGVRVLRDEAGGGEGTRLASAALEYIGAVSDIAIWSVRVRRSRHARLALDYVLQDRSGVAKVIATNWDHREVPAGLPPECLRDVIATARDRGIPFLAAAGNAGPAVMSGVIAGYSEVITVGGWVGALGGQDWADEHDRAHQNSARGARGSGKPNLLARWGPRSLADSTSPSGSTSVGGTSVAVGEAAGVVARIVREGPLTHDELTERLRKACIKVRADGDGSEQAPPEHQGWGALDAKKALAT